MAVTQPPDHIRRSTILAGDANDEPGTNSGPMDDKHVTYRRPHYGSTGQRHPELIIASPGPGLHAQLGNRGQFVR